MEKNENENKEITIQKNIKEIEKMKKDFDFEISTINYKNEKLSKGNNYHFLKKR
jgi:hypothetical protein